VWGLSIYQSYKYGGKQRGGAGERLAVSKMQLLGLQVAECEEMKAEMDERCGGQWDAAMALPDSDKRRIACMQRAQPVECDEVLREELRQMAEFGFKCELEALNEYGGVNYLAEQYLPYKVAELQAEENEQARFARASHVVEGEDERADDW